MPAHAAASPRAARLARALLFAIASLPSLASAQTSSSRPQGTWAWVPTAPEMAQVATSARAASRR